jgi:uncharacterized membrane protein (DUF2068 family)
MVTASDREERDTGIWLIALFKLFKGALLLAIGIGALSLLHKDVAENVGRWIADLHVNLGNEHVQRLLSKLGLVDDKQLERISVVTFFYSALLLTEGVGLSLRRYWAEYLTVFTTISLIPLEIYELFERVSFTRIAVLIINVAVVVYLVARLHQGRKWPFG